MARRRLAATLSVLRIINLRAIRRHLLRATLAAIALGGGVAVVVAVLIEATSVSKAVDDVGYRIAGPAPLRIVGAANHGGIAPANLDAARAIPGVSDVVPVIRAVTLIRTGERETYVVALGIDCTARWIIDPAVCPPDRAEPPVPATSTTLGAELQPESTLVTDAGQLRLDAVQRVSQLDTMNNGLAVVLPLSVAKAQFARGDRVDLAYVTLADDARAPEIGAQLRDALGPGFSVLTRSDPDRGFNVNTVLLPLLSMFALIAVGVGVILISQITRLSVEERRHEIAVAGALGASPLSAVTGFLAEAAILGAAGSVLGTLVGIAIAHPVVGSASALTQLYLGVNVPVVVRPDILAAGVVVGIILAVLAAAPPSLSALHTAIASELSGRSAQEDTQPRRIWPKALGLLALGTVGVLAATLPTRSGGLEAWQATLSSAAVVVAIVGMLTAAAYLSAQVITMVRVPERIRGATVRVALTGLRANPTRTTAIAGAVAVPVAVAMLLSSFLAGIDRASSDLAEAQASGRLVAGTTRFSDWGSLDAKISPETADRLAALPGVERVERMVEIEIALADGAPAYVRAEDHPTYPFPVLAGSPPEQTLESGQLIIGGVLAREQGLRVGDTVRLGSGAEARDLAVGTIVATPEVGGRRIYMPYRSAEEIFGPQYAGLVRLKPKPGVPEERIETEIAATSFAQPVKVVDARGYENATASGVNRFLTTLNALKYGLLAIAFVSVSATLLLVGMRRRRETALIQALGATPSKVFAVTTAEAVVACAVGAVFGAVLSVAIMEAVRGAAVVTVGSLSPLTFSWVEAVKYSALAAAAAILASIGPAWKSTQTAPATALREE
ncbi:FtsX-like permease family protein [Mycobacterium sp. GA-2829]|uniref:ABC transporter permease n=1 Tax=Mycobacterium sp. GA-2829 TaxID=1772283 RepID=UPI0007403711|nr:FtsX-like permease family protein [Mycobacterium sp. GA-2829]KUI38294.1 ABC transporter permease [Mycobacterium sp. GA-2829]